MNMNFATYQTQKVRPQSVMVKLHESQMSPGSPSLAQSHVLMKCESAYISFVGVSLISFMSIGIKEK